MWGPLQWLVTFRIELTLFVYYLVSNAASSATMLLVIQKVCYPEGSPGASIPCDKAQILKETSYMSSTLTYLKDFLPGILVLMAGSWRDNTGRTKPLVLVGLAGEMLSTTFSLISTFLWSLSAWLTVIVDGIVPGLTGNTHIITLACFSSITEDSTESLRTTRLGVMYVAVMSGLCIALAGSGFVLGALGFSWFYILMLILYFFTFVLSIFTIKDHPRKYRSGSVLSSLKSLKKVFLPRPNGFVIWLLIISDCLVNSILRCEATVSTQFVQKVMKITPQQHGIATFIKLFLSIIAGGALTPLLTRYFKIPEFLVAILCTIPGAVSSFCMSSSKTLTELYIYSAIDFSKIMYIAIMGSLVTKAVKKSEVGVYSGFISLGGAVFPAALNPLYLYIFHQTFDYFPGGFFLLSGSIVTIAGILTCICWFFYDSNLTPKEEEKEEGHKDMPAPDANKIKA